MSRWHIVLVSILFIFLPIAVVHAVQGPKIEHIGMLAEDIIGVTIQDGRVETGQHIPYKAKRGDEVDHTSHHRVVKRKGQFLGWLVGPEENLLYTEDRVVDQKLNTSMLDDPTRYSILSAEDSRYQQASHPLHLYRKSKASNLAQWKGWPHKPVVQHTLYLKLPYPLETGKAYRIRFQDKSIAEQTFVYDPRSLRSEAVHISHLGFRPDDPAKVAFLSCWLGSGGPFDYSKYKTFRVFIESGQQVYQGKIHLSKAASEAEDGYKKNYNGTNVYIMDFSSLKTPGRYRVSVDGIGCSYPFTIAPDVWHKAFTISARGFYHQRSGITLGPPYTDFERPRCFFPDDGVTVYHSTCPLMDSGNGLNAKGTDVGNFANLVKGKTDHIVKDAWGGYMDAGDWDRRIQHLIVSRYLIELAELFPQTFGTLTLNIPESTNTLPDIVDEALFNLDCYRRMQTAEGGIRGGIESAEHPRHGECSWHESLDILAYAPGIWSSYVYAGVAAQAAHCLAYQDPKLSTIYQESALKAMNWAETRWNVNETYPHQVRDDRNLAAAELFRLTGDLKWHELFMATTVFTKSQQDLFSWKKHEQRHAPWVYLRTKRPGLDQGIQTYCREAILREADNRVRNGKRTGFRWTKYDWQPPMWGAFVVPDSVSLVRAHMLTNNKTYLETLVNVNFVYPVKLAEIAPLQQSLYLQLHPFPRCTTVSPGSSRRSNL